MITTWLHMMAVRPVVWVKGKTKMKNKKEKGEKCRIRKCRWKIIGAETANSLQFDFTHNDGNRGCLGLGKTEKYKRRI